MLFFAMLQWSQLHGKDNIIAIPVLCIDVICVTADNTLDLSSACHVIKYNAIIFVYTYCIILIVVHSNFNIFNIVVMLRCFQDLLNDFTCQCTPGYTGRHCDTNIDECSPNPCNNGGVCTVRDNNTTPYSQ